LLSPLGQEETFLVKGNEPLGQTVFEGSDVDSKGNIFVGYNYGVYKSVDNGRTFTLVFTIPYQPDPWTLMAGRIWCVYVDSRDYVFVSAISTNRFYRSTDGGASFIEVLNLGRAWNDGGIINMDEDELGNLYACEYGADKSARLFKSSTGGEPGSWSNIRDFDTRHLHNVRMNPYNNWLYVATSEDSGLGDTESRSVFRSKDHGASWTRVVQQPTSLSGFVAMAFLNDWVVLGEDNAGGYSNIDRFRDDGNDNLFSTQTVWSNPSVTNFYGGTKLGNHLVFATGREGHDCTLCVLESTDAQNWNVVDSVFASSSNDDHRGILNPHPNRNGRVYTCQVVGSAAYFKSTPVVDGTISPHEYDGGLAVQLTGQWDTNWTVDTYILWDTQYMYVAVNEPVPGPTTGRVSWIEVCMDAGPKRAYLDCFCFFDDGALQYCGYPKPSGGWGWYPSPYPWSAATNSSTEFKFKYTDYGIAYGDTIKMAIDRNLGPPPPYPLGQSAYWPGHEEIVYPTPDLTKWGNVTLGNSPGHLIDGTISPHEYDGGLAVQLVGPYPSGAPFLAWTTNAYISWDTEYFYVAVNESVPLVGPDGPLHSWIEFQFDAPGGYDPPAYHSFVLWDDRSLQYVHYPKPGGPWHWDGPVPSGTGGIALFPYQWWAVADTATEFKVKYTDFGIALGDTIKMSIDRGKNDLSYFPYGECAVWPNPCIFYPTADSATWGNVTLGPESPSPPDQHVVDGLISSGEYDGGLAVQLIGRTDPNWTETAYIDWSAEYLYVAVNESVPASSGHISWIEFAIDAGPARSQLDAFVLFDDHVQSHVVYPKPGGPWTGTGPSGFLAASNTATEFRIKYTDFGVALGDTIKLAIDRNSGPAPPPPYGFAAFWSQNATVYDGTPNKADPTTWGTVDLSSPPEHYVDGLISPGEYDGGMNFKLIGRTNSSWTVDAYIAWDAEYLYVGVNESVPATTEHKSWIEFAIDAGPARSYLDAFALFDDHIQSYVRYPKPSGPWSSQGAGNFLAASDLATEFRVKYTDYGIAFGDTIKMSIDRNEGPSPPPPYGFAAYWPQGAVVYDGTPPADPTTWGNLTLKSLGLEFALVDPNPNKPFEYCKTFEVEVYASNISGNLTDYNFTIAYDSSLMKFLGVNHWGVLAAGHVDNANPGTIQIWSDAGGQSYSEPRGLLFALTFHVEFNDDKNHIWRTHAPHELNATVSIRNDLGGFSFTNGSVPITGITIPTPLVITIHLIRGDVDCNGEVNVLDLRTVAAYYDQDSTDSEWPNISKYDVTMDNIIDIFDLVAVATNFARG
jgi:hypothetical protein